MNRQRAPGKTFVPPPPRVLHSRCGLDAGRPADRGRRAPACRALYNVGNEKETRPFDARPPRTAGIPAAVIARHAVPKQSRGRSRLPGLLRRFAPRNDGRERRPLLIVAGACRYGSVASGSVARRPAESCKFGRHAPGSGASGEIPRLRRNMSGAALVHISENTSALTFRGMRLCTSTAQETANHRHIAICALHRLRIGGSDGSSGIKPGAAAGRAADPASAARGAVARH